MVDIHCHIIYGVDDGPTSIEDSLKMIWEAKKFGINRIVATPHHHIDVYHSDRVQNNFNEVKSKTKEYGVDLFLGYENFICTSLSTILQEKRRYTLNKSPYLLFELPFDLMPLDFNSTIQLLCTEGLIPIIAHPERNVYLLNHLEKIIQFTEIGCLLQLDASSIIGFQGTRIKNFSKKLLKLHLPHFIASDAHKPSDYALWYQPAYKKVEHWVGKEYCEKLFTHNQSLILPLHNNFI